MTKRNPLLPTSLAPALALTVVLLCTGATWNTAAAKDPSTMVVAEAALPVKYPENFVAEMKMTSEDLGGKPMDVKVYKLGTKQRTEMKVMGQDAINIMDFETKKATTMVPSQKMATVMALDKFSMPLDLNALTEEAQKSQYKEVGREKVGEVDTIKYELSDAAGEKSADLWASTKTRYPVKMVPASGNMTVEWTSMEETTPDASLFVVPSDYRVIDMGSFDPKALEGLKNLLPQ